MTISQSGPMCLTVKKNISGSNLFLLVASLPIISNYIRKTAVNLVRFVHNDQLMHFDIQKERISLQ
jgi:hypothetical protein